MDLKCPYCDEYFDVPDLTVETVTCPKCGKKSEIGFDYVYNPEDGEETLVVELEAPYVSPRPEP